MNKKLFILVFAIALSFSLASPVQAQNSNLVPCKDSQAFLERQLSAPDSYYFKQPYKAYSEYLMCGDDGLPHLPLSLDRAIDVAIPFGLFLYIAGFIGWSGRAYLQASGKSKNPEENEIFINLPMAIQSLIKGLLWPFLFFVELTSGQLTARDREIYVSPR
jgi:photosystem I subunit 3